MRWRKVGVVAANEFHTAVRTKAFLISLFLMPLLMVGSGLLQATMAKRVDTTPRPIAVIDPAGTLYPALEQSAAAYNQAMVGADGALKGPKILPERVELGGKPEPEVLLALSDRVRSGGLAAFAVLPEGLDDPAAAPRPLRFYSNNPNDEVVPGWLGGVINGVVRSQRLRAAGIDPELAARLGQPVPTETLTLLDRAAPVADGVDGSGTAGAPGAIVEARKVDKIRTTLVPLALMIIVFMVVMTTTPPLLQAVIEEKMSRVSEVLLGSLTPFELMFGKLLGGTAVALLLAGLYGGGAFGVAHHFGYTDAIPPQLLGMTILFVVLAVFLFGSLYLAMGSACSELKDAQSLMMPVMLLSMLPMFVWTAVLRAPNSPLAVGMSLFPPATPYLMLLRMAMQPPPPLWQVGLSVLLTALFVLACVWAAAKIFRIGLLMQGKAPSFAELARWVVAR